MSDCFCTRVSDGFYHCGGAADRRENKMSVIYFSGIFYFSLTSLESYADACLLKRSSRSGWTLPGECLSVDCDITGQHKSSE